MLQVLEIRVRSIRIIALRSEEKSNARDACWWSNSSLEDPYAKAVLYAEAPAKTYADHSQSYSTNEICIYWNSPLICDGSFMQIKLLASLTLF